ncbi:MAG: hypothetical protein RLZZ360_168 [Candidatus Parcubacteria bacterium]|jgi:hypothetical protein
MTKKTVTTLGIATLYFAVVLSVLIYAYVSVHSQKADALALATTLAEQTSKQSIARSLAATFDATIDVRTEIASYFLEEKETITFIAEIEALAQALGVSIEPTALDFVTTESGRRELKTGFAVKGTRTAVLQFMKAIETIPYHSRIASLQVVGNDNEWSGQVDLFVTIKP